jgi:hypothetical protein
MQKCSFEKMLNFNVEIHEDLNFFIFQVKDYYLPCEVLSYFATYLFFRFSIHKGKLANHNTLKNTKELCDLGRPQLLIGSKDELLRSFGRA